MRSDEFVKLHLVSEINKYIWTVNIQAARGAPNNVFEKTFDEAYNLANEFLGSDREKFMRQIDLARQQLYEDN